MGLPLREYYNIPSEAVFRLKTYRPKMLFTELDQNLWIAPYHSKGLLRFPAKTIAIKLGANLAVFSPGPWSAEAQAQLESFGNIRWLVAPNSFHHLFYEEWTAKLPQVETWGPLALAEKEKSLHFTHLWPVENPWGSDLEIFLLEGMPKVQERLIYHKPSGSLIVTDLFFNLHQVDHTATRMAIKAFGAFGKLVTSNLIKKLIKDQVAFKTSLEPVLKLEPKRLIMSHGDIIEEDAPARLREVLDWV